MDAFIENILQSTTTRSPEKVEQPSADPQPIPTATSVTEKMVQLSIVRIVYISSTIDRSSKILGQQCSGAPYGYSCY